MKHLVLGSNAIRNHDSLNEEDIPLLLPPSSKPLLELMAGLYGGDILNLGTHTGFREGHRFGPFQNG